MAAIPQDLKNARTRVHNSAKDYIEKGDFRSLCHLYTEDCRVFFEGPSSPAKGREELQKVCEVMYADRKFQIDTTSKEIIYEGGDLAIEVCTYSANFGKRDYQGNILVIWKKVDGKWLIHEETMNSNPTSIRMELIELFMKFSKSFAKRDFKTAASIFSPDAIMLPPSMPVAQGREDIEKLFEVVHKKYGVHTFILQGGFEIKEISENVCAIRGTYAAITELGTEINRAGVCQTIKKIDGKWYIHHEMIHAIPGSLTFPDIFEFLGKM